MIILAKFAWKPILGAVRTREESINQALASAEDARKEMQNLKADNEKAMQQARAERDEILKEARQIKDKMIGEAEGEAQQKADVIVAKAKESIEMEKRAAMADIKNQVATLSIEIAEKVIGKELSTEERQHQMIDKMLQEATLN